MDSTKNIQYRINLLIFSFLLGIGLIIFNHLFFVNKINKLDCKIKNYKSKLEIGEFIVEGLYKIKANFYQLATSSANKKHLNLVLKRLYKNIDVINDEIKILEFGGVYKKEIHLNIVGHNNSYREIKYTVNKNLQTPLEIIDLKSQLISLDEKVQKLKIMFDKVADYIKNREFDKFAKQSKKIRLDYKSSAAFFLRRIENIRRLLYEGDKELKQISQDIAIQKKNYHKIEFVLMFIIISFIIIFGIWVTIAIKKSSMELQNQKNYVAGILDAQQDIVVVTDGKDILDANLALFNFFNSYHNLDEFKEEHKCICDYFIDYSVGYISNKMYENDMWIEYAYKNIHNKVAMKKDGKLKHFKMNLTKRDMLDKKDMFVIVLSDITNEIEALNIITKQTEQLSELNRNLQNQVMEEVDKNRQKDKQMILQSRHATMGEMIGNIAHQWRQPLNALGLVVQNIYFSYINDDLDEKKLKYFMDKSKRLTGNMSKTIDDFRDFFKPNKAKENFKVADSINSTIELLEGSLRNNSIKINKVLDKKLSFYGYPNEFSQVILNILSNAKDVLKNKNYESIINIKLYKDKNDIITTIEDNGGGIKKDVIGKIFDPYFSTKEQGKGAGIGLYMSKNIIETNMNGRIEVKNSKNGAEFKITLNIS